MADLSGEFFLIDGDAVYADGDVGDFNHDMIATDHVRRNVVDVLDQNFEVDWEGLRSKPFTTGESIEDPLTGQDVPFEEVSNFLENKLAGAPQGREALLKTLGISEEEVGIFKGSGDPRGYGIRSLGWTRIAGNNAEVFGLNRSKLRELANGLWDAGGEDVERMVFNIDDSKTGMFYENVPYQVLASENMNALRDFGRKVGTTQESGTTDPSVLEKGIMATDLGSKILSEIPPPKKRPPGQELVKQDKRTGKGQMFRGLGSLMKGRVFPLVAMAKTFWDVMPEDIKEKAKDDAGAMVDWLRENKMHELVGLDKPGLEYFKEALGTDVPKLAVDNPGGDWLARKIKSAKEKGRNEYGAPHFGDATASFRKNVNLPVDLLATFKGRRGEQGQVREKDLAWLKKQMEETGKLPLLDKDDPASEEYAPFITVGYDGIPWVSEGNHRIMAAKALGWKTLPVELRYFDGGERTEGLLSPEKVRTMYKDPKYQLDKSGLGYFKEALGLAPQGPTDPIAMPYTMARHHTYDPETRDYWDTHLEQNALRQNPKTGWSAERAYLLEAAGDVLRELTGPTGFTKTGGRSNEYLGEKLKRLKAKAHIIGDDYMSKRGADFGPLEVEEKQLDEIRKSIRRIKPKSEEAELAKSILFHIANSHFDPVLSDPYFLEVKIDKLSEKLGLFPEADADSDFLSKAEGGFVEKPTEEPGTTDLEQAGETIDKLLPRLEFGAEVLSKLAGEMPSVGKGPPGKQPSNLPVPVKPKPSLRRGIGGLKRAPFFALVQMGWDSFSPEQKQQAKDYAVEAWGSFENAWEAALAWKRRNLFESEGAGGLDWAKEALMPTAQEPKGIMSVIQNPDLNEYIRSWHGTPVREFIGGVPDIEGHSVVKKPIGQGAAARGAGLYSGQARKVGEAYYLGERQGRMMMGDKVVPKYVPAWNRFQASNLGVDEEDIETVGNLQDALREHAENARNRPFTSAFQHTYDGKKHRNLGDYISTYGVLGRGMKIKVPHILEGKGIERGISEAQDAMVRTGTLERALRETNELLDLGFATGQETTSRYKGLENTKAVLDALKKHGTTFEPTRAGIDSLLKEMEKNTPPDKFKRVIEKYDIKDAPGSLYELGYRKDDVDAMLDLDKTVKDQPEIWKKLQKMPVLQEYFKSKGAFGNLTSELDTPDPSRRGMKRVWEKLVKKTGGEFSEFLVNELGRYPGLKTRNAKIELANQMKNAGIPGTKFWDQDSRYAPEPPDITKATSFTINGLDIEKYLRSIGRPMGLVGLRNNTPLLVMDKARDLILDAGSESSVPKKGYDVFDRAIEAAHSARRYHDARSRIPSEPLSPGDIQRKENDLREMSTLEGAIDLLNMMKVRKVEVGFEYPEPQEDTRTKNFVVHDQNVIVGGKIPKKWYAEGGLVDKPLYEQPRMVG